jgi:hypothetical protein
MKNSQKFNTILDNCNAFAGGGQVLDNLQGQ